MISNDENTTDFYMVLDAGETSVKAMEFCAFIMSDSHPGANSEYGNIQITASYHRPVVRPQLLAMYLLRTD